VPHVCHLARVNAFPVGRVSRAPLPHLRKCLQSGQVDPDPQPREGHGDRTPSFAVMWCRLKRCSGKTPLCRDFTTGQADAGTRTPDPIITRYSRYPREGAWLSHIRSRSLLRVPRVCQFFSVPFVVLQRLQLHAQRGAQKHGTIASAA
jgi:hypothetical protein